MSTSSQEKLQEMEMERKANRLKNYDYSSAGYYFLTLCTINKEKILCHIVGDDSHIILTEYGKAVERYIKAITGIDRYVIMPNHIHLIVRIEIDEPKRPFDVIESFDGTMRTSSPTISQRIKFFKTMVTKSIGKPIFQRSFYDHIIRDENDYLRIYEYIENNPYRWNEDKYYF